MFYLFTQTFFWLLAAFIVGLLVGWWLRSKLTAESHRDDDSHIEVAEPVSQADIVPDSWAPEHLFDSEITDSDHLQKIDGVSSKIEVLLNTLGVYKFEQIAAMSNHNLAWINDKLGFEDRIEDEQWVEQARVLASGQETDSDGSAS